MLENFVTFPPLFAVVGGFQLFSNPKEGVYSFKGVAEDKIDADKIEIYDIEGAIVETIAETIILEAGDELLFEYQINVEYF